MLSGTWRRSPVSSPSMSSSAAVPAVARSVCSGRSGVPSTVILEAQYDYAYRGADGRQVSIREGERFILLRKTNSDWWQVRRIGVASKTKPLYVPATYVKEVPIAPLPSYQEHTSPNLSSFHVRKLTSRNHLTNNTLNQYPETKTFCRSMENIYSNCASWGAAPGDGRGVAGRHSTLPVPGSPSCSVRSSSNHLTVPSGHGPIPRSRSSSSLAQTSSSEDQEVPSRGPRDRTSTLEDRSSALRAPCKSRSQWDMAEMNRSRSLLQVPSQFDVPHQSCPDSPLRGERTQVKGRSQGKQGRPQQAPPPSPYPGQRALQTLDLWEQYQDPASGRLYYVNTITKESSWKPPRRARHHQHPTGWTQQTSTLRPRSAPQTYRHSSHLSLPLTDSTNGTIHRLSPDFLNRGQRNADNTWQFRQSIQRAVSSDTLNVPQCATQRRNSGQRLGGDMLLSHSQSMILPESQSKELGYSVTDIVVQPPSTDSSPDSHDNPTPELKKAGLLNKTKIAEGGRKLRKNWNASWVVLVGNSLMFFKDPKSQTPSNWTPGNSRPESSVDLRGAKLHWANELSSKKNVFKLRTVTGNEFLLQSETDSVIREWYHTIHLVIERLDRENPIDNVLLYCMRRSGSMDFLDHSDEDDCRGLNKTFPRSSSNLENSERKRVKSRLKQLILKRPPLQSLQEKGLIKDQVFGCSLEMLCERERSLVPRFVRLCTAAVERRGLETDGIYRVSGNLAVIQKLRFLVNHEGKLDLDQSEWEDIHVITGALKLFFRELPEPLVPYNFYTEVVESVKIGDYQERLDRLKLLVQNMPAHNHNTMHFMFSHLKRVMEHSDSNRMSTQNIGIVFGPTLMRPECDNANMAINMVYQNQAVELILREFDYIFGS